MNSNVFRSLVAASSLFTVLSVARGADVYTNEATFLSGLKSGSYTENFSDPALLDVEDDPVAFAGGAFSYTISTSSANATYFGGERAGAYVASDTITISFSSGNVTAVGANFYARNSSDVFVSSGVTVTLSDGTVLSLTPPNVGSSFRGFTSVGGTIITSLTLSASQVGGAKWATLDNLTVGAVPEPATYASFLGLAVLGFVVVRRRSA